MSENLKFYYASSAKIFTKANVTWKELAEIYSKLTNKWTDEGCLRSHKLAEVGTNVNVRADMVLLHNFLYGENGKAKYR